MEHRCGCRPNIDFLPYIFQCSRNGNEILVPLKYLTSCVRFMCVILVMDTACVYWFKYLLLRANPVRKSSLLFLGLLYKTAKCTAQSTQPLMLMFSDTCGPRTSQTETCKPGTMFSYFRQHSLFIGILVDHVCRISIRSLIRRKKEVNVHGIFDHDIS